MPEGLDTVKYDAPVMSDQESLLELCNGDRELAWFISEWISNGRNATKAYKIIRPHVTYDSARALGCMMLARLNMVSIMAYYDVGIQDYLNQLRDGMNADTVKILRKYDKEGNVIAEIDMSQPDHKTRRPYHEAVGKLLGIEKDRQQAPPVIQFNFTQLQPTIIKDRQARGLPV